MSFGDFRGDSYRREVLDADLFFSLGESCIVSQQWRNLHNCRRPYSPNNYKSPNTAYHFQVRKNAAS